MKPRLYLRNHIWICQSIEPVTAGVFRRFRLGYGYTPTQANEEWSKR
jgi:hypothetical protein